jgi:hypothetical protein
MLNPGTWGTVLAGGLGVLAVKLALDLRDRAVDDRVWRAALGQAFGSTMREDPDASRLARTVIEYRVRLAMAEARAPRAARARLAPVLPRMDAWLQGIMRLAPRVAALRTDARFHTAMAGQGRARIGAGAGVAAQVRAGEGFGLAADAALRRLENAVGAFGAASSQMILALSHSDVGGTVMTQAQIAMEIAAVEAELAPAARQEPEPVMPWRPMKDVTPQPPT